MEFITRRLAGEHRISPEGGGGCEGALAQAAEEAEEAPPSGRLHLDALEWTLPRHTLLSRRLFFCYSHDIISKDSNFLHITDSPTVLP